MQNNKNAGKCGYYFKGEVFSKFTQLFKNKINNKVVVVVLSYL